MIPQRNPAAIKPTRPCCPPPVFPLRGSYSPEQWPVCVAAPEVTAACAVCGEIESRNAFAFHLSHRYVGGLYGAGVEIWLAANHHIRLSCRMGGAFSTDSKLCAVRPRHAQILRILSARLRSTWQGEGKALSVASSLVCRARRVESLPLSTPSGARAATAFYSAGEVKGNA